MEEAKIVSEDPEVMSGEIVFAGTRIEVKTLVDNLKAGHTLDEFLDDFPTVSREQAEGYLDAPPEAVRQEAQRVPDASRRQKVFSEDEVITCVCIAFLKTPRASGRTEG